MNESDPNSWPTTEKTRFPRMKEKITTDYTDGFQSGMLSSVASV
jgi:hypothetical protein